MPGGACMHTTRTRSPWCYLGNLMRTPYPVKGAQGLLNTLTSSHAARAACGRVAPAVLALNPSPYPDPGPSPTREVEHSRQAEGQQLGGHCEGGDPGLGACLPRQGRAHGLGGLVQDAGGSSSRRGSSVTSMREGGSQSQGNRLRGPYHARGCAHGQVGLGSGG